MAEVTPAILDIGSCNIKAGLADRAIPYFDLENVVGRPIASPDKIIPKRELKDIMVCDETYPTPHHLDLRLPIEHGVIRNWDDECLIFNYIFKNKLKIDPKDHPLFVTDALPNKNENRKKMLEVFFEQFEFPKLRFSPNAILALYARGLMTGVVVDSGATATHIVSIYENFILSENIERLDISGNYITEQLAQFFTSRGCSFSKTSYSYDVRDIKENLCFVSTDINHDRELALERINEFTVPYKLYDSQMINVTDERFEIPEILFQPKLSGFNCKGLSDLLFDTIMKTDFNMRREFFEFIVVSGGTSMLPGFATRLQNDLKDRYLKKVLKGNRKALEKIEINVEDAPNKKYLVYNGATILANLIVKKEPEWISKEDYNETGAERIVTRIDPN